MGYRDAFKERVCVDNLPFYLNSAFFLTFKDNITFYGDDDSALFSNAHAQTLRMTAR